MPIMDEEERPKKKLVHEIGQDLTLLSVEELRERIALLKEEIARLEANVASKQASRSAADPFFNPGRNRAPPGSGCSTRCGPFQLYGKNRTKFDEV
jgi:uncharacterized small protein (DUF1192 family)